MTALRNATQPHPDWAELTCEPDSTHVQIGSEYYALSQDGLLMPTRKGQKAPDTKYFK